MNTATKSPRLSREESRLQTRAHLLAAAKRLFVERGFGATSLRDIAAEAGYTQGAFYSNFASKEELFVELMQERSRTQVTDIARTLSDPSSSADDILNALEVWAQTLDAEPEWSVLGVEFKLQGRRNPVFAAASQACSTPTVTALLIASRRFLPGWKECRQNRRLSWLRPSWDSHKA